MQGVQTPRLFNCPPYDSTSGDEAVALCQHAGLELDPWQQYVLRHSLGERADGRWASRSVGLIVPRQNGKGEVLVARELAGLFLLGERLILHSAHEFKTAQEAFFRINDYIHKTPSLAKRVEKVSTSHGEEGILLKTGQRLRFVARSKSSARGFSAETIILDEAFNLTNEMMAALGPVLLAQDNSQVWYTSSAGMEVSDVLRGLRERGMAGGADAGSLAFFEWSAHEDCDSDDRESWKQANPALGYRVTEEKVEDQRMILGEDQFRREILGIWFDESANVVIPLSHWESLSDRASSPGLPLIMAVDYSPERQDASIALSARNEAGKAHVELIDYRPGEGTGWVLKRILELQDRWTPAAWVLDPSGPVGGLLPSLRENGIEPILPTSREYSHGCGQFYDMAMNNELAHLGQASLTSALASGRKRLMGDSWAWSRKDSKSDISPLVAATLAVYGMKTFEEEPEVIPGAFWA